jgi:hypothetical protein
MQANTTGANNTSFGFNALSRNTISSFNTAIGTNALFTNNSNSFNTAVGTEALKVSTSDNNTAVGYQSLTSVTTGGGNIGIGISSGTGIEGGSNNIFIGNNTSSNATGLSNSIAIGNNSQITAEDQMVLKSKHVNFVVDDITGPASSLDIKMINFFPLDASGDAITGIIPQAAINGLDNKSQETTGDLTVGQEVFVGAARPDGTSRFFHGLLVDKELTVGQAGTFNSTLEVAGDVSLNQNVFMQSINDILTFKTYEDIEIAGSLSTDTVNPTPISDTKYTTYGAITVSFANIGYMKSSTDGQYIFIYSNDAPNKLYVSKDYGSIFNEVNTFPEGTAPETIDIHRRIGISNSGQKIVIVSGDTYVISNNYGASFKSNKSSTLTYTCATITGDGKYYFLGTLNERLYVSIDGIAPVPHDKGPVNVGGPNGDKNHYWRYIVTNNSGKYIIAFTSNSDNTNEKYWYFNGENTGDSKYNNESAWSPFVLFPIPNKISMLDDGSRLFYQPTGSSSIDAVLKDNFASLETKRTVFTSSNDGCNFDMTFTTRAGVTYAYIIDKSNTYKIYVTTNCRATDPTFVEDPNFDTTNVFSAIATSGHGGYTYVSTADSLYTKQYKDGTVISVIKDDAFVLTKTAELLDYVSIGKTAS